MSSGERDHAHWGDDLAAYVLEALDAKESAAFERHLADCETCRSELRWLRPAIEVLTESVHRREPRPELREQLMSEVREDAESLRERPAGELTLGRRTRRFALRPAVGLAVTAVAVAGVAGYIAGGDGGEPTTTVGAQSESGNGVTAKLEQQGDSGALELSGLEQLPSGEVYQAWVQRGERIEPSSLFAARNDGTATAAIPDALDGADAVMVSVEPRGGRSQPTSAPIVKVPLR